MHVGTLSCIHFKMRGVSVLVGRGGGVSWASRESVTVKLEQKTKKFNYYKTEEISTLMWDLIAYLVDNNDKIEA